MAQWFRQIFESAPTTPSSNIDYNEGLGLLPAQSQPDQFVALPENRIPVDVGRGLMADDFSLRESMRPADDIRIVNFDDAYGPQTEAGEDAVDLTLKFAQGTIMGSRMLVDAFGADSEVSKSFRGAEEYLDAMMSAGAREDKQAIARLAEQAKNEGVFDQLVTGFEMLKVDPAGTIVQALGTSVPVIAGTVLATLTGGTVAGLGVGLGLGATQGSGIVKGAIYETVKQELLKIGMPEQEAESRAVRAQEWGGENTDQILTGAGITALGAITGLESAAVNALIRKFSQDVAKKTSVQAGTNIGLETVTEGAQGFQEQTARNIATQRQGDALGNQKLSDTPTTGGAYAQGVMEAGAGMGAATTTAPLMMSSQEEQAPAPLTTSSPNYGTVEIKSPKGGNLTVSTISAEETESLASEPMMARRDWILGDVTDQQFTSRIAQLATNEKFTSRLPNKGTPDRYAQELLRLARDGVIAQDELLISPVYERLVQVGRTLHIGDVDILKTDSDGNITKEDFLNVLSQSTPSNTLRWTTEEAALIGTQKPANISEEDAVYLDPSAQKQKIVDLLDETNAESTDGDVLKQSTLAVMSNNARIGGDIDININQATIDFSIQQAQIMTEWLMNVRQILAGNEDTNFVGSPQLATELNDSYKLAKRHLDASMQVYAIQNSGKDLEQDPNFSLMRGAFDYMAEAFGEWSTLHRHRMSVIAANDGMSEVSFKNYTEAGDKGREPYKYMAITISPSHSALQDVQGENVPAGQYHGEFGDMDQLVFSRLSEVYDDDGLRYLHIEEIQSDQLNQGVGSDAKTPLDLPSRMDAKYTELQEFEDVADSLGKFIDHYHDDVKVLAKPNKQDELMEFTDDTRFDYIDTQTVDLDEMHEENKNNKTFFFGLPWNYRKYLRDYYQPLEYESFYNSVSLTDGGRNDEQKLYRAGTVAVMEDIVKDPNVKTASDFIRKLNRVVDGSSSVDIDIEELEDGRDKIVLDFSNTISEEYLKNEYAGTYGEDAVQKMVPSTHQNRKVKIIVDADKIDKQDPSGLEMTAFGIELDQNFTILNKTFTNVIHDLLMGYYGLQMVIDHSKENRDERGRLEYIGANGGRYANYGFEKYQQAVLASFADLAIRKAVEVVDQNVGADLDINEIAQLYEGDANQVSVDENGKVSDETRALIQEGYGQQGGYVQNIRKGQSVASAMFMLRDDAEKVLDYDLNAKLRAIGGEEGYDYDEYLEEFKVRKETDEYKYADEAKKFAQDLEFSLGNIVNLNAQVAASKMKFPTKKEQKYLPLSDRLYEIGLKKVLALAVERGYDGVSVSDYKAHIERWDETYEKLYYDVYEKRVPNTIRKLTKLPIQMQSLTSGNLEERQAGSVDLQNTRTHTRLGDRRVFKFTPEVASKIRNEGFVLARQGETSAVGVSTEQAVQAAQDLAKRLNVADDIRISISEGELAEGVKGAVLRDGHIIVSAKAHASIDDIKQTILHEMVGHYGIRRILSQGDLDTLMTRINLEAQRSPEFKTQIEEVRKRGYDEGDPMVFVEEVLAMMAETEMSQFAQLKNDIVAIFTRLMRALGINTSAITKAEVLQLLGQSKRALQANPESDSVVGQKKIVQPANRQRDVGVIPQRSTQAINDRTGLSIPDEMGGNFVAIEDGKLTDETLTNQDVMDVQIGVNERGLPRMSVDQPEAGDSIEAPSKEMGRKFKINMFKRSAGWNWIDAPAIEGDFEKFLVSVETTGKHFYTLEARTQVPTNLTRYPNAPSEPRLRPTGFGEVQLGEQIGKISVRGKEHPVYATVTIADKRGEVAFESRRREGDRAGYFDMTKENVDTNIRDAEATSYYGADQTKGYFVRMPIDDFLLLTTHEGFTRGGNFYAPYTKDEILEEGPSTSAVSDNVQNRFDPEEVDRPNLDATPFLILRDDEDESGNPIVKVAGHEGRHRAALASAEGATTMPVFIRYEDKLIFDFEENKARGGKQDFEDLTASREVVGQFDETRRVILPKGVEATYSARERAYDIMTSRAEESELGLEPAFMRRGEKQVKPKKSQHGVLPDYLYKLKRKPAKLEAGKMVQDTTIKNVDKQLAVLDEASALHDDPSASTGQFNDYMSDMLGADVVPMPPHNLISWRNDPEAYGQFWSQLSDDQRMHAMEGLELAQDLGQKYQNGEIMPEQTALLMLWGILSRGVSPSVQESAYIQIESIIRPYIRKALAGEFNKQDVVAMQESAKSAIADGSYGRSTIHNIGAFGRNFLMNMSKPAPNQPDKSRLQALHDVWASPASGREVRRYFHRVAESAGIDNKVVSFLLLVTGKQDVMILDRVQIRNLFDDGRFDGKNIYDGWTGKDKKAVAGSSTASLFNGARGLAYYESIEDGITKLIENDERIPHVGAFHWMSWLIGGNQEADHGTLLAVRDEAEGKENYLENVSALEGRYDTYKYGGREYMKDGKLHVKYKAAGETTDLPVTKFNLMIDKIKNPKNGVVPNGFKVTTAKGSPWWQQDGVNQERLAEIIRESSG